MTVATQRKKEIKASLPRDLRDKLEGLAQDCGLSPMAYAVRLTVAALQDERVIRGLSPWFRRGYVPRYAPNTVMLGRIDGPEIEPLLPTGGDVTRFPVKLPPEDYMAVGDVAHSLSCSLAQALTVLLSEAIRLGVRIDG
jgi:hypothetical protein